LIEDENIFIIRFLKAFTSKWYNKIEIERGDFMIHYFSDALIAARKKKGLTKHQVAEQFGWLGMYYGRFEKGHIFPTNVNIYKFAQLMDMSVDDVQILINKEKEEMLQEIEKKIK